MNLLTQVVNIIREGIPKFYKHKVKSCTPVGAGFYAMQTNISKAGSKYTKLVKRDKSRVLTKSEFRNLMGV